MVPSQASEHVFKKSSSIRDIIALCRITGNQSGCLIPQAFGYHVGEQCVSTVSIVSFAINKQVTNWKAIENEHREQLERAKDWHGSSRVSFFSLLLAHTH